MSVTPLRLFHDVAPAGDVSVYVAAEPTVLRRVLVVNPSGVSQPINLTVAGKRVIANKAVLPNDVYPLDTAVPIAVGEDVHVSSGGGALTIMLSGFTY